MISTNVDRKAFSYWLRTGRLPAVRSAAGLELKFNPWHDPEDGRFTFANTGDYHPRGSGGGAKARRPRAGPTPKSQPSSDDLVITAQRQTVGDIEALSDQEFDAFERATKERRWTERRENAEIHEYVRLKKAVEARRAREKAGERDWEQQGRDFAFLYGQEMAMQAVGGAAGRFVIAPAVRAAAPRIERVVRPQAYARKLAERMPRPAPTRPLWVDENASMGERARLYNDAAPGVRRNPVTGRQQAPSLYRTTEDGKRRLVRFDGFEDDAYPVYIDRKTSIRFTAKAKDQALRQSVALRQNHASGRWDVPDEKTKREAMKLLRKLNIDNIGVKVVKE